VLNSIYLNSVVIIRIIIKKYYYRLYCLEQNLEGDIGLLLEVIPRSDGRL
jgi:hypothetical protein